MVVLAHASGARHPELESGAALKPREAGARPNLRQVQDIRPDGGETSDPRRLEAEILLGTLLLRTRRMKLSTLPPARHRPADPHGECQSLFGRRSTWTSLEDLVVQLETGIYTPAPKDAEPTKSGATPA